MKNNESIWIVTVLIVVVIFVGLISITSRIKRLERDVESIRVRLIYGDQK